MLIFYIFFAFLLLQRGVELVIAKQNEHYMLARGAYEVGQEHYTYLVLLHTLFFCSLWGEVSYFKYELNWWSLIPFSFFILAQIVRIWSIATLGRFWNTKIIILPRSNLVRNGPYRFLRHPNYVVVVTELLMIPLIFQAYFSAIIFSLLNAYLLLYVRIPLEEKALQQLANEYDEEAYEFYLNKN